MSEPQLNRSQTAIALAQMRSALLGLSIRIAEARNEDEVYAGVPNGSQQEELSFQVSDTGIGMTPEQLRRVFDAFAQAGAATAAKYGGTGLGLAISRRLCQMMGGDLEAVSQPAEGTVFTARLPVVSAT